MKKLIVAVLSTAFIGHAALTIYSLKRIDKLTAQIELKDQIENGLRLRYVEKKIVNIEDKLNENRFSFIHSDEVPGKMNKMSFDDVFLEEGEDNKGKKVKGITASEIAANVLLSGQETCNLLQKKNINKIGCKKDGTWLYDYKEARENFKDFWLN